MPIPVSRGRLPAPVQSAAVRSDEGSNSRRSEDETTAAEPSVASPVSLRADAGRLRAVQGRGILATMGKWWQLSEFHFKARGRANFEAKRPGSGPPRGAAGAVEWTLHGRTHRGSLSGDAVSHGYGLATASGERAWLCPQLPPLPKWLLPPPARGHPVSSRGRIERHGAYKQPRIVGAAGNCAGSQYAARRANLGCINSFGAVALTAWLGDRQCQKQWRWRFSGLGQGAIGQSG